MKWIHIIGVCGKATSLVAKMFKDMGWFVTGSDAQFFPPASTFLIENNINTVEGYNYQHLTRDFWRPEVSVGKHPDVCLAISTISKKNKEYRYAKLREIPVWPMAKILGEYLVKDESIVVVGTAGKTTTTALIAFLLQNLAFEPSYMVGAETVDLSESIQNFKNGTWSVVEGDEFHNSDPEIEGKPKFLEYKPKYLIITNIGWEHQDVFSTQASYVEAFRNAVELVPEDGVVIARAGDKHIDEVVASATCKVIRYGLNHAVDADYYGEYHVDTTHKKYVIKDASQKLLVEGTMNLIGEYNVENILASYALLTYTQIDTDEFSELVAQFHGVRKRLEILHSSENIVIVDDFGIAPHRAQRTLETLHQHYPNHVITAIYEPNSGSRLKDEQSFNNLYADVFTHTSHIIIPSLSEFNNELASTNDFIERLQSLGHDVHHVATQEGDDELVSYLQDKLDTNEKHLVVFFSSYRLTAAVHKLANQYTQ